MPAPFDYAYLVCLKRDFIEVSDCKGKEWFHVDWDYVFTEVSEAQERIDDYFKVKEWISNPVPSYELVWGHGVVYSGYGTDLIPFDFGDKVTIVIVSREMVYTP